MINPWPVFHRLTYSRTNHANFHVRGYKENGNINTPLELAISNQIDRFNLVIDVINRVESLVKDEIHGTGYAHTHGTDAPEINNWHWMDGCHS